MKTFLITFLVTGIIYSLLVALFYAFFNEPFSVKLFLFHLLFFGSGMGLFAVWQSRKSTKDQ